jgi:hypothetical protein
MKHQGVYPVLKKTRVDMSYTTAQVVLARSLVKKC